MEFTRESVDLGEEVIRTMVTEDLNFSSSSCEALRISENLDMSGLDSLTRE